MADVQFSPQEEAEILDLARHAGQEVTKTAIRIAMLSSPEAAPSILLNAALMLCHVAARAAVTRATLSPAIDGKSENVTAVMRALGRGIAQFPDPKAVETEMMAAMRLVKASTP